MPREGTFGEMPRSDLWWDAKRKREVELRKETAFAEGEHASQGKEKCRFQAADNKEEQTVPYGFVEVIQHLNVQKNWGGQQLQFLRVLACFSRLPYNICWHRNWGNCCNIFMSVFPYSPYSLARILGAVQHGLQISSWIESHWCSLRRIMSCKL